MISLSSTSQVINLKDKVWKVVFLGTDKRTYQGIMITFNSLDKYSTACLCIKAIFNDKFNSKFPQRTLHKHPFSLKFENVLFQLTIFHWSKKYIKQKFFIPIHCVLIPNKFSWWRILNSFLVNVDTTKIHEDNCL